MPATVSPRARQSKSQNPKCPKCGGPLTVVKDTPDITTLECPKCRKAGVAEWLGTAAGEKAIRATARRYRGLACAEADDLAQDIALAVLEADCPPAPESEAFAGWLDGLAKAVAGGNRDVFLTQPRGIGGEEQMEVAEVEDEELYEEPKFKMAEDAQAFYDREVKARRRRIARVLAKLPPAQREAVRERFFRAGNLAAAAKAGGKCDSSVRMNLMRAKRKLAGLLTPDGYAVAA